MAYVNPDFTSKKALKDAVKNGEVVTAFQPGLGDIRPRMVVEGPHYPKPHTWYAQVEVDVESHRVIRVIN
jgi:hypothetical protein